MTVGARVPDPKKEQQAKVTGCRVALVRAQSRCASGSSAAREGCIHRSRHGGRPQHTLQKKPKVFGFLNTKVLFYRVRCESNKRGKWAVEMRNAEWIVVMEGAPSTLKKPKVFGFLNTKVLFKKGSM